MKELIESVDSCSRLQSKYKPVPESPFPETASDVLGVIIIESRIYQLSIHDSVQKRLVTDSFKATGVRSSQLDQRTRRTFAFRNLC